MLCYHWDLQKIMFFSISRLWSLWRSPGHSESFCIASTGITDTQSHCQTRTGAGDTSILVWATPSAGAEWRAELQETHWKALQGKVRFLVFWPEVLLFLLDTSRCAYTKIDISSAPVRVWQWPWASVIPGRAIQNDSEWPGGRLVVARVTTEAQTRNQKKHNFL